MSQVLFKLQSPTRSIKYFTISFNAKDGSVKVDVSILCWSRASLNKFTKSAFDLFDINGFEIRFFTKSDVVDILMATGFTACKIIEAYEEPASLYWVFARKQKDLNK
jgi:hypothetical protein